MARASVARDSPRASLLRLAAPGFKLRLHARSAMHRLETAWLTKNGASRPDRSL